MLFNNTPTLKSLTTLSSFSLAIILLSGCRSVDFDAPKTKTYSFTDTDNTFLGREMDDPAHQTQDESGFYLLGDPVDSLAARLLLAERAELSIDAQYYLITNDQVGYLFIEALLKAADRGVRVRLLLDDIQTKGYDAGLVALDSHPNFEIRIFNPFAGRSSKLMDGLTNFSRVNRRMHNKSFTVDYQIILIGGRNIAGEYFGARDDSHFSDLDVLGIGPVVNDVSTMFDLYWNHVAAVPVEGFAKMPKDTEAELAHIRDTIKSSRREVLKTHYAEVLKSSILTAVEQDESLFIWDKYHLVYDSPDKVDKEKAKKAHNIIKSLAKSVGSAEQSLVIISPYFVPLKPTIEGLIEIKNKGVNVTIITNSLEANNHSVVHSGYAPSRKPLLEAGINIYEVKAKYDIDGKETEGVTLHTKAFIVDEKEVFIGSFNWDPRSAYINTELGVIIESEEIAQMLLNHIDTRKDDAAYKLSLNEKGQICWTTKNDDETLVYDKDPRTSWWKRFKISFLKLIPIKGQL